MSSMSCCGIWHPFRREGGAGEPRRNTDSETQRPLAVRPAPAGRLQSARSTNTPCLSASIPPTTHVTRTPNTIKQGSVQYSPQRPTMSTTGEPGVQQDLWSKAIATLSDDDKASIELPVGDTSMLVDDVVDNMIVVATKWQEQCEKSGWKTVNINGYKIYPSNTASKAIIWLNKFKEIGDIIVQYDPAHAALPWAATRFLLQAMIATEEEMAASLAIIERVTRIIHRCRVFEELYNRKTVHHTVIENLEAALIRLYTLVLQGLVKINKFLSKQLTARAFYAIFHSNTGSGLLASLENGEAQVEREISACEGQRMADVDARLQEQLHDLLDLWEPVLRVDKNIEKVLQQLDRNELTQILQWISPVKYRIHHAEVAERRTRDTCNWLLQCPKVYQWSSAVSSITLWLQGFPGSGKTYLTSRIIDEIEATLQGKENDEGFAFFYCNRDERNRGNALDILRSYVRQLSTTPRRSGFIHPQLEQLYVKSESEASGWTLGLCQEYLVILLNLFPRTTLVLDALDECLPKERTSLLDFFDSLPSKSSKPVKIFISSRPEGDIRQRLTHLSSIEIQATDNGDDIAKSVMQRIEGNDEIVQTLLEKSEGMFQWAMLQIEELLDLRSEYEIKIHLGKLPKTLEETYDKTFHRIERLDTCPRALSFRALQWIIYAYYPLTNEQLLAAIHVDPDEGILKSFETTEADLLDWCANLIRVDSQHDPPVWRVTHLSVVEYLETRWTTLQSHCVLAKACLMLLQEIYGSEREQEAGSGDIFYPDHGLHRYVRHHWINHVQTQEIQDPDPKLAGLLKTFLGSLEESSIQYRRWHRQVAHGDNLFSYGFRRVGIRCISPNTASAFLVCSFGLYNLLRDWWDSVSIGLPLANSGDNLLALATMARCSSALAAAACRGHTEIIQLLINNGADVNMLLQSWKYGSALAAAAAEGYTEMVQFLLDHGANVNMLLQSGDCGSALAAAAAEGYIAVVQLLINHGANINMALQNKKICIRGHTEIAQLLVNHGTTIDMAFQTGNYGSALASVAFQGQEEVVKSVIRNDVDVTASLQYQLYKIALEAAQYPVSLGVRGPWWDRRGDKTINHDKSEMVYLLQYIIAYLA
ncbi:hypothetical protein GGS24DRAFT_512177 [Hypoxylon argillaceum]|nr:hypothetical protein GGS24DRAFT_512177 [Hypoxylon argillaceum]